MGEGGTTGREQGRAAWHPSRLPCRVSTGRTQGVASREASAGSSPARREAPAWSRDPDSGPGSPSTRDLRGEHVSSRGPDVLIRRMVSVSPWGQGHRGNKMHQCREGHGAGLVPVEHSGNVSCCPWVSVFSSVEWDLDRRSPEGLSKFGDLPPHLGPGELRLVFCLSVFRGWGLWLDHEASLLPGVHFPCRDAGPGAPETGTDSLPPALCPSRWCLPRVTSGGPRPGLL